MIETPRHDRRQRWIRLGLMIGVLSAVWLIVLPVVGRWQPIRQMIQRNQAAEINPRAMFYSDLEHLHYQDGILRRR